MRGVVLVDCDRADRAALEELLRASGEPAWIRAFESPEELLAALRRRALAADLDTALVAQDVRGMGAIGCVRALRAARPAVRIVVLFRTEDAQAALAAVRAGADGCVLKSAPPGRLLAEIRGACTGGAPLGAEIARAVVQALRRDDAAAGARAPAPGKRPELTPRERDVLRCLARGCTYGSAARELGIGVDTIRTHVRSAYAKLGVHSAAEAVSRAMQEGLL